MVGIRFGDRPSARADWPAKLLILGAALLALAVAPAPSGAGTPVDLELMLAIDTSGSVDPWEFKLQLQGVAAAFRDPEVQAAIEGATPNGLAAALVQWSGPGEQIMAVDWTKIVDARSAAGFAARIEAAGRQFMGRTGLADALEFGIAALATSPFDGYRKVIDLSGDGEPNDGRAPGAVRDAAVAAGITVNGLAVMTDVPGLDRYFRQHIVGGPGAFLMTAADYQDFVVAIRRKLLREIRGTPLADAGR